MFLGLTLYTGVSCKQNRTISKPEEEGIVTLPEPRYSGTLSVEEAIFRRKSTRYYKDEPLTLQEVSQLLWAAGGKTVDGVTGATRAYPSAGGIYPLEIYLVAGDVEDLEAGVYRYLWREHALRMVRGGDLRQSLMGAALRQGAIGNAPVSLVFIAIYERTMRKYGERGRVRYVHIDMGGAGQNVYLQAEALDLGTVAIGAFYDGAVKEVLGIEDGEPLCIMPIGRNKYTSPQINSVYVVNH
ncbi:MAG TPA: SagB/ThcOx family dehydrogenase [Candidatus Latescibacteria bacterium]|nr:SagB/ThcOx family dehydrogenase [Candidatus Latescibacterota bacterium]